MRVAVYTIALNEEKFVKGWYESAKDADYILIADTGSDDDTLLTASKYGIEVASIFVRPWRFDNARNAALALLPEDIDYCIALDMDEVLAPGWREELEKAFADGVTRPRYKYTWSWNPDGSPGLQYGADKIHSRFGYRWKHPVHEVIVSDRIEEKQGWYDLEIHHHPDNTKPRSQYLPLLELSTKEDPSDDRNAYYYARELFFNSAFDAAAKEFKRHLSLPSAKWNAERAASYRYLAKCEPDNFEHWIQKAIEEDPHRRESKVEYAQFLYRNSRWQECYEVALRALEVKEKPLDYLWESFAWNDLPHDLASIAAWNLGNVLDAITHAEEALKHNPNHKRIISNLNYYKEYLDKNKD